MLESFRTSRLPIFFLTLSIIAILLACRTVDLLTNAPSPTTVASNAQQRATRTLTQSRPRPTITPMRPRANQVRITPTDLPPPLPPTDIPPPTDVPPTQVPEPTQPPPTRRPLPTPTDSGPTVTPAPTRCPQTYCVVYRGCQPDAGNTIIEGYVYKNGVPENGVAVRVAKQEGAYPLVDDFVSGNSAVNRGKPDPNTPGYYFLQIVAGAPREGNWWVFVVDVPNGTKVISESKLVHTNDDPYNPANCQHAFVDFVR